MLADVERAKASTIQFAAQTTPEQEAESLSLSRRTGAPAEAVRSDLEGARMEAQRREMAALSPTTQKWLTENPNRYALVKDELGTLDKLGLAISRTFQSSRDFGLSSAWHTLSNQMAAWDEMGRDGEAVHRASRQPIYAEEIGSSLFAGYQRALGHAALVGMPDFRSDETRARAETVAQGLGFESDADYQASRSASFAANQERRAQQIERVSEATDAQFQNIAAANEADSLWEALGLVARSPRAVGVVVGQSLGMGAPGLALTAATGGMGRAVTMTAAGGSSGWVEYGASISEALAESGVDMTDPAALARALRNPELMAEARSRAAKRGIAIGAFDAATAGLAGQLLINARRGAVSAASRTAGEVGIQAAGGSLGELTAGLVAGDGVNYGEIILEGIAEVPFGAVEAWANYVSARERGQVRWINEQLDIVRRSGEGSDALSAATIAAGNANLARRSPEEAQAFAAASGAEGGVYLDADAARVLFQDNWQTLVNVVGGDTILTEQLASGDVVIPADQYFGVVAGLPNAQEIARNARTQADALSAVELEKFDIDGLADAMAGDADAAARAEPGAEPSSRRRIQDDVYGQLLSTNRYSSAAAESQAKLFAAGITRLADMWGTDPWTLYERRMAGIRAAPAPGQADPRSTPPWAGTGRLDALLDTLRSDDPDPAPIYGPSIADFVVSRGGVTDVGGDLRSMDANRQRIGIINKHGEDLDSAREAAAEAGYLPMDSTVADLLELIDRDLRGDRVYSPEFADRARVQFEEERKDLVQALEEAEALRDVPWSEVMAMSNQQIAEALFGRSFEQTRPGSFNNPLPITEMESAPVGAWVAGPDLPGIDTRRQIQDVPLDRIDATEFDSAGELAPEKRADAARYAEAMRAGEQFPNGRGSELPNGMVKLQDGHRRYAAARATGAETMRLAVSPLSLGQAANFDQDAATDFDPSGYRPEVVSWAQETYGDAIAPNGRPVWQNFTAWFGDSQVVDDEGRPVVAYHGTGTAFTQFDTDSGTGGSVGAYFSEERSVSSSYAMRRGGQVLPVYLRMENPLVLPSAEFPDIRSGHVTADDRAQLQAAGYDGIIGRQFGWREFVAFDPEQIKSATANRGNFGADQPGIMDQSAFHGTPHDVDRFSLQRIGTGEGNQAFGWGLYFASKREVADFYRRNLAGIARNIPATMADDALRAAGGDRGRAIASMVRRRGSLPEAARGNVQAAIDWLRRGQDHGRLYQVDIPEDSDLLDYDAPLAEQPEAVQRALAAMDPDQFDPEGDDYDAAERGGMAYTRLAQSLGSEKAASEALLAAGIPGLRYLDGGSRAPDLTSVKALRALENADGDIEAAADSMMSGIYGLSDRERAAQRKAFIRTLEDVSNRHNYVIWDESAVSEPVRLFQDAANVDAPVFYSAMLRAVEEGRGAPRRADAGAWKGWLDGAQRRGEMRKGERDWRGIDAWLDEQDGLVTREALADFIRANQVQIEEVVLGAGNAEVVAAFQERGYRIEYGPDQADFIDPDGEYVGYDDLPGDLQRAVDNASGEQGIAKFGDYTVPGGQNYRELLLTMPNDASRLRAEGDRIGRVADPTPEEVETFRRANRAGADEYRSSHFDQPNILTHVRFNERVDSDGNKVLFIEEIQSDWHQAGREQGYSRPDTPDAEVMRLLDAEGYSARNNGSNWVITAKNGGPVPNKLAGGTADSQFAANLAQVAQMVLGRTDLRAKLGATPDAPFKATDEWAMLAFKRMARWAVDNGFDRIAWTPGDVQAERYDMSRQINSISVPTVSEDGSRAVSMETADSTSFNMMVDANGVVDGYGAARQFSGRNLSEVIGKELAEKVMGEAEGGVLSGDGLKVGGEGMRAFYDSILPKAVNKWAKRMGGRVGRAAVPAGPADHLSLAYFQEWMQRNHPDVAQPTIADEWSQGEDSPLVSEFLADSRLIESHSLDVTDAMRDAVSQGMTLFQSQLGDRLVAVHNLSAENLLFSDNLGGLPAPSIGITKAASPFRGFGSISLIGGRALAEPGTTNPVFSADAYTQRFPEILWPKVRVKKADAFIDSIDPEGWNWEGREYLTRNPSRERAIESAVRSAQFMRGWLRSQGETPAADVTKAAKPRQEWMDDAELLAVVDEVRDEVYARDLPPDDPRAIRMGEAARAAIERYVEGQGRDAEMSRVLLDAFMDRTFDESGALTYAMQDGVITYAEQRSRPPRVDPYLTRQALSEQIGERQTDFEAWVTEQISGVFDEPQIMLGRKKVPMTLENVVEAMTRQGAVAGREQTMTFGPGQVVARNAKRYRTIEEIQADRDRVVPPEQRTEAKDALEKTLESFRDEAIKYFTGTNYRGEIDTWEALDMSMKSLADASKKAATAKNVAAALRRNGFDGAPDEVAQAGADALVEIRQAVASYFEAKPQRAVSLSEFPGAVIPADASQEVRDTLDRHGIRWMEYGEELGLTQEQAVSQLSAELDGGTGDILFQPEGAEPAQAPRGQIEIFPDRRMAISLFEGADRSTFLHETGHFFLEVLRDIAADPNAPDQARQEMAVLLDWFGIESVDQIGREHHEQFARGFEKYLAEGRAPSPELQSAFSAFKAWLLSIYRNLLNLNVNLTDDVRGVMDRLLASDAEIEAAHIRQGMEPMSFGEGVLEEAQIRQYAEQLEQATERERAALGARLIAAHDRAARRWYKEQKAEVRKEVEAEYAAMPVYRAARVLAGAKKYADGTDIPAELQGIKLSKEALASVYGEPYLRRLRGLYRVKGGIDQDLAAMKLGFETGDALVNALANREDMDARVQAETDERMRERHGDPMTDGTLAERAMDAVHDDHRMRVLAWEMSVLEALAADPAAVVDQPRPTRERQSAEGEQAPAAAQEGQQAPQRRQISPETRERIRQAQARRTAATRALAEAARRAIGKKALRDIRPHDYLAAERKAARKATAAAEAGNYVEGLQAKRQQAFNAAMYREAMRVQKRADSNVRFLRKAASDQTRRRVGKEAGKFYVDALDAIFDGIEVRGVSRPEVARRAALREWVARMQDEGNSTAVPEMLLARVESENVTNLADMTVADVEGLREAVENILHLARTKNRLQTLQGKREWEEVKAEMVARLEEQRDRHGRYGISDADRAMFDRIKDLYAAGSNWVLQPETMVEWLDGGDNGPFHDLLWDMAQAAERKREALNRQVGNALQEAMAELPAADRKALDRRFDIESLGGAVSGHSILSALLNMGNEGNRDKLLRGGRVVGDEIVPFTEQQIAEMFSRLTRPQAEAVQKIWDAIDQLWPEIVALEESMNGIAPEKVEASQFTVMTRDGPVSLRGGYYPVMYDPKGARVGQFSEDEQAKRVLSGQTPIRASTSKGHVEKRTDFAAPLLLDYHSVITRHLDGVIGDISYRQFLRQVYKVLGDPDIRRMIDNRIGPGAATGLRQSFERGAVGHFSLAGPLLGPFQKVADAGMTNLSSAALGLRIPLAMANVVAVPIQATARVKARNVIRGLLDYYLSGGPNIIGNMRRNAEMVQRLSPLMLRRSEARSVELSSIIANLRGKRGFRAKMIEMAMAMHQWTVPLAENAVWMGAYQQAQSGGANIQEAAAAADKAIRQTQTKTSAAELSRGEGGPMRMFMQFAGPLVVMNNRMQEAGLRGLRGDVKSWPQALGVWFSVAMGAAWSFELMMGRGPEGDDGEDADIGDWIAWAALKLGLLPFAAFPLIRDVAGFADSGFSRGTPLVEAGISLYEATIGTAEELFSEDEVNVEKIIKSQVRASGAAFGVPSNQLLRTGDYLMSVGTGEHELGNPAAEAYYLVQGAPDEE